METLFIYKVRSLLKKRIEYIVNARTPQEMGPFEPDLVPAVECDCDSSPTCTQLVRARVIHRKRPWPTSTSTDNCVDRNSSVFSSLLTVVSLHRSHRAALTIQLAFITVISSARAWNLQQHDASDQRSLTSTPGISSCPQSHRGCQTQLTSIPTHLHSIHVPRRWVPLQWL